jgi:hypothetical protein
MKSRPFYAFLGFASLALLVTAAACGDDETGTTSGPASTGAGATSTTASSTATGMGGGDVCALTGAADPADCAEACSDLYDCGALECGGMTNCAGFSGAAAEKTAFVGDANGGCIATCTGQMALIALIDPASCDTTVAAIKGASGDFADVCDNGFGTGGSGGMGGMGGGGGN